MSSICTRAKENSSYSSPYNLKYYHMRILLLLALSAALTGHLFLVQGLWTSAFRGERSPCRRDTLSGKLDELVNAYVTANGFNGSILVARDGFVLLDKGYGW